MFEGNAITKATTNCRGVLIHEKEVREKLGESIANFIDRFEKNKMYLVKFILCNTLSSMMFIAQFFTLTYLTGLDKDESSAITNVWKWIMEDNADRRDGLSEVFPKWVKCIIHTMGPGGNLEKRDQLCLAPNNSMQELMHIIAIYMVGAFAVLNLIDYLLITLAMVFFKQSNTRTNKVIKRLAKFTGSQILLCILISKNVDIVLWEEILDQLAYTTHQNSQKHVSSEKSKRRVIDWSDDNDGIV